MFNNKDFIVQLKGGKSPNSKIHTLGKSASGVKHTKLGFPLYIKKFFLFTKIKWSEFFFFKFPVGNILHQRRKRSNGNATSQ